MAGIIEGGSAGKSSLDEIGSLAETGQLDRALLKFYDLMTGLRGQVPSQDITVVAIQRGQLKEIQRQTAAGILSRDETEQALAKLTYQMLGHLHMVADAVLQAGAPRQPTLARGEAPAPNPPPPKLEALVNDCLINIAWLEQGVAVSRAVCKVGSAFNAGTGFVIAGGLLVTNNHVLPTKEAARGAVAIFNFQDGLDGTPKPTTVYRLLADSFVTDAALDCSIVRIGDAVAGEPVAKWGTIGLELTTLPQPDDPVSIIQHPLGAPKRIGMLKSVVAKRDAPYFFYTTDTREGSSGSPVLDIRWRVVGLHRAAGEQANGAYVSNQGVLMQAIAAHGTFSPILQA